MFHSEQCEDRMLQATRLWSKAQPVVGAMIAGAVFDFHDAEDLVAEVAATVVRNFDRYDPDKPFAPWALGIARKLLLRYYERQAAVRHVYFDEYALRLIEAAHLEIADEIPARQEALQECMEQVRGKSRRVLGMRYEQGLRPETIAEALGMSRNAVWVMLHRVRNALRDCVNQKLGQAK